MNVTLLLMSVFFCFTFASGIGIYWVAQRVFTVIQQMVINSYLNKVDMDELVQKNVEKTNKKRAKKGLPPTKVGNVDDMLKSMKKRNPVKKAHVWLRSQRARPRWKSPISIITRTQNQEVWLQGRYGSEV